jgi:hypothetical protein
MNIYYVYFYLRSDFTPYYIGKGKEKRAWEKHHKGILTPKNKSKIILIEQNLTELQAFILERYYIRWFGRKDNKTGILRNRTDGGEGVSGRIVSEKTKTKISKSHIGKQQSPHREETKNLISKHNKKPKKETKNMKIAQNKPEQKLLRSIKAKEYLSIEENYNKRLIQLEFIRNNLKLKISRSQKMKNKIWCNDGFRNYRLEKENIPTKYNIGKIK